MVTVLCKSISCTKGHNYYITFSEHLIIVEHFLKLGANDRPKDRQTDRKTDIMAYRAAIAAKNIKATFYL